MMNELKEFMGYFMRISEDMNIEEDVKLYLAEIGNRVKTSKLALWDELFNVLQEYETDSVS